MSAENLGYDADLNYRQLVRDFIKNNEARFEFYEQKRMIEQELELLDIKYDEAEKARRTNNAK